MTSMSSSGRRKVHYTLPNGSEMVEEFDLQTDELLVRKKRVKTVLGANGEWEFEVGEPPARVTIEGDLMRASSSNPSLIRKDRPHAFEWRVRNLPYPKSTYSVTVDEDADQIVIRTSNKKYFKRITIEDMQRSKLVLDKGSLSWTHENSTLIVQYKKPSEVLAREKQLKQARLTAPDVDTTIGKGGAGEECKQQ